MSSKCETECTLYDAGTPCLQIKLLQEMGNTDDAEALLASGMVPKPVADTLTEVSLGDVHHGVQRFEAGKMDCPGPKAIRTGWLQKLRLVRPTEYDCQNPNA